MLHRMVFKIRRLMEKIPGGRFVNYAAALFLLKEQNNTRVWTDDVYMKTQLLEFLETDWESDAKFLKEEVDNMDKKSFKSFLSEKTNIEESQKLQAMMALDDAGIEAVVNKKGKIVIDKKDKNNAEKALKNSFKKGGVPEIQYEEVELREEFSEKDFDALKKGDTITIEFKSAMSTGKSTFKVTAKNVVGKARVEKATLQNVKKPNSVKFFLYKRGNKVSLAQGDMAASVVKYTVEEVEMDEAKGTAYPATIDTLRKIVKDKQHQTIMFKSGQAIVDLFTASAMVQVYDALKPSTRKKFEDMIKDKVGFMRSQAFAMKMLEDTQWRDDIKKISESFEREASRTISTFSTYITEGRPAIEDPDAPRAGDKEKARRVALQKQKYKPVDVSNIARKHKIKLDGEPVPGDDQNDWLISIKGGITLDYNYDMNQTTIAGWKVDRKKIRAHITKYEQGGSSYEDLIGVGRKLGVTGFESAFELIGEQLELEEAAHANSVAGGNVNLDPHKKKKRINAKVEYEDFGGARVFVVSNDRFHASRLGKSRYARYEKYVGNDKLGETIRLYGRQNPQSPIILKNEENGTMLYLKYGASKRQW